MVSVCERDEASNKTLDEGMLEMCALEEEVWERLPKWVRIMISMLNEAKEERRKMRRK